jgi:hypothetical protein
MVSVHLATCDSKMTDADFITFQILSICKGGGYTYCRTNPPHPKANQAGLYPLHRVVCENKLGRFLHKGEVVHHIDENKQNNHPDNLTAMTNAEHSFHHQKVKAAVQCICPVCKASFSLKPAAYRLRINRNLSKQLACSRSCGRILAAGVLSKQ